MGLQNHIQNPDLVKSTIFGLWRRSCPPVENIARSLRVVMHKEIMNKQKANPHLAELEAFEENRLPAQQILELYKPPLSNAFNKCVQIWSFERRWSNSSHPSAYDHRQKERIWAKLGGPICHREGQFKWYIPTKNSRRWPDHFAHKCSFSKEYYSWNWRASKGIPSW